MKEAKLLLDQSDWDGAYYLVGYAVEGALKIHTTIFKEFGQNTVSDRGTNLALNVVANYRQSGSSEFVSPLFGSRDEDRKRIYKSNSGINRTLGVEARRV
ncbi:MAG TPA: hypothetical protein PK867_24345, partial [Pirellulales bacterium]|nr:hypothetical protein [Pirellulales bacterium]